MLSIGNIIPWNWWEELILKWVEREELMREPRQMKRKIGCWERGVHVRALCTDWHLQYKICVYMFRWYFILQLIMPNLWSFSKRLNEANPKKSYSSIMLNFQCLDMTVSNRTIASESGGSWKSNRKRDYLFLILQIRKQLHNDCTLCYLWVRAQILDDLVF